MTHTTTDYARLAAATRDETPAEKAVRWLKAAAAAIALNAAILAAASIIF